MIRTRTIVCTALALLALPLALAQGNDLSKVKIKATKLGGSVYLLEGAGGNIAASVGEDGTVLVDAQFAALADKIRATLAGVTDKPVRCVVDTHYHFDHTDGNPAFSATAPVIAHENVRARLASGSPGGNGGSMRFDSKPSPKAALPTITLQRELTIHANGEAIRLVHFPAGHTDGDVIVFFPKANVVHMGDEFVRYGFPYIDVLAGGSVQGMIAAMDAVIAQVPADVKVIPGHGALSTREDMQAYVKMLKETTAVVEAALRSGQTLESMKQGRILARWKSFEGDFVSADAFLETLVWSLTGRKADRFPLRMQDNRHAPA